LGSGTGTSVLYCRTSVPPVFSIKTAFMVLGRDDMARTLVNLGVRCKVKALSLADATDDVAARMEREARNIDLGRVVRLRIN
jgi:hypothetical protein